MLTTAKYRKQALQAEKSLLWSDAAILWELAIEHYPNPRVGFAQLDIERMRARSAACRGQEMRRESWIKVVPCQNKNLPPKEPWPILCCCGATIVDEKALREHFCEYLPRPRPSAAEG